MSGSAPIAELQSGLGLGLELGLGLGLRLYVFDSKVDYQVYNPVRLWLDLRITLGVGLGLSDRGSRLPCSSLTPTLPPLPLIKACLWPAK